MRDRALVLLRERDYTSAEHTYRAMLWLAETSGNIRAQSSALVGLGTVDGQRGDLIKAREYTQRAFDLVTPLDDAAATQPVVANLGIIERRLGNFEAAKTLFARALALALQMDRQDSVSRVYNNMGLMYSDQGNARLAHEYFSRSLALKKDDGDRGTLDMANSLSNLGSLYSQVGDYPQALSYYRQAIALLEKIRSGRGVTSALSNIGNTLAAMGQRVEARQMFERALGMAQASGDPGTLATVLYNLGTVVRDDGNLEEAEALQRRSLAIREAGGEVAPTSESLTELAGLMLRMRRFDEADTFATRALDVTTRAGIGNQRSWAEALKATVLDEQGDTAGAVAMYEASIRTVEELRGRTPGAELTRQTFLSSRLGPYLGLAALHAARGRSFDALQAVERARARTLLDILAAGRQPRRSLTEGEQQEELRLSTTVLSAESRLEEARHNPSADSTAQGELVNALRDARLAREAQLVALYASKPDLRIARGDAPILSHDQLSRLLTPGTAAIEVAIYADKVWLYLATSAGRGPDVSVRQLQTSARDLVALAQRFSKQVATRDLAFTSTSRELYDVLFGGVDAMLTGVTHVIVVPDAELWRVPFQALRTPRNTFLIEEHALSYAPSLSALVALRERKARRAVTAPFLVAFGDPSLRAGGRGAVRLPEAAREVQEVSRLYGTGRSLTMVGAAASEAALRSAARRASVLHVATHGVIDDVTPMYSHLKLAASAADSTSDGRLEAWELADMEINADLVVLSACQTAGAASGSGEGVIGLSWALFAAGASTAVVSQWEVDSASTTALMIGLHKRLLSDGARVVSASEALRLSAISLMKDPRYRHPFYWAGFIVAGS